MVEPRSGDSQSNAEHEVSLTARFVSATARQIGDRAIVPDSLARAGLQVLEVDGAGLSTMVSVLRQPLAATNDDSRQAEELQTSLGEGPCLYAVDEKSKRDDLQQPTPCGFP